MLQLELPVKQVLQKLDLAGRMVARLLELSEFDVSYEKRGSIKAQVLADFMEEMITSAKEEKKEVK